MTPREWIYCFFDPRPGWDKDNYTEQISARDQRFKIYADGTFFDLDQDPLERAPLAIDEMSREARQRRAALDTVLRSMRKVPMRLRRSTSTIKESICE